jgi:hypothetical protein
MVNNDYVDKAKRLVSEIGVHQLSEGAWAFTDLHTASHAHIHHSQQPVALAAYAAVDPTFAAGRFPNWALVDMVDKVPCMDGAELTALSMVCEASVPTFPGASDRGNIFGQAVWGIVEAYSLAASRLRLGRWRRAYSRSLERNAQKLSRNVAAATDHGFNDHALVLPG